MAQMFRLKGNYEDTKFIDYYWTGHTWDENPANAFLFRKHEAEREINIQKSAMRHVVEDAKMEFEVQPVGFIK